MEGLYFLCRALPGHEMVQHLSVCEPRSRCKWKDSASSAMNYPEVKWFNTRVSVNLEADLSGRTLPPLPCLVWM